MSADLEREVESMRMDIAELQSDHRVPTAPPARLNPGGHVKGGGSQHWNTPREMFWKAGEVLANIDLDPFSNPASNVPASDSWHGPSAPKRAIDGFEHSWAAVARTVFFNPPWKRSGDAVRKAELEYQDGCEVIGLIPSSINSQHWPIVERAPARCYPHKRPSFLLNGEAVKGNPKDIAIIYWGPRPYRFADVFSELGRIHFGVIG